MRGFSVFLVYVSEWGSFEVVEYRGKVSYLKKVVEVGIDIELLICVIIRVKYLLSICMLGFGFYILIYYCLVGLDRVINFYSF